MMKRLKHILWEILTSLAMLFDGTIGLLCLGFYRPTVFSYLTFWRALGERPQVRVNTYEDGEGQEGKCMFYTGKKK
jgi:hypothetical protein